jgi:hypothetical protein
VGSIGGTDPVNAPGVGKSGVGRAAVCVDGYVIHDVVVVVVVVEMLPQALKALRKLSTGLMCDFEASIDPEERIKLATAYAKLSEQRRILLRIPGPPTGGSTKGATPAPINAQILDAEPIEHVSTENPPLAAE